ncbi:hypothetical protein M885DRAFT_619908 [Pelagophyceae sp. CCMP2097]|nr:hypothetical protein M885DRAFT_619908 [Pelagophyceae sp. CCMP2097]
MSEYAEAHVADAPAAAATWFFDVQSLCAAVLVPALAPDDAPAVLPETTAAMFGAALPPPHEATAALVRGILDDDVAQPSKSTTDRDGQRAPLTWRRNAKDTGPRRSHPRWSLALQRLENVLFDE